MVSVALPVLVRVTGSEIPVPTWSLPKARLVGERLTTGCAAASEAKHPRTTESSTSCEARCDCIIQSSKAKGAEVIAPALREQLLQHYSDHIPNRIGGDKVELAVVVEVTDHDRLRTGCGGEVGVGAKGSSGGSQQDGNAACRGVRRDQVEVSIAVYIGNRNRVRTDAGWVNHARLEGVISVAQ